MIMKKRKAQNLLEFIIVIPLLIVIIFGIIEFALFWRTVQTVQGIALEAAAGAASQYVDENGTDNPAVDKAIEIVNNRAGSLGIQKITLKDQPLAIAYGIRPFAFYQYTSQETVSTFSEGDKPVLQVLVDHRDPYQKGIVTQVIFQYQTILMGAEFTLPSGRKVIIIPRDIEVSSTKIQQYNNY